MKPLVVVFDWDGTVINSLEIKIANAGKLFNQQLGLPVEQVVAAYRRYSGVQRRQLFDAICRENSLPPLAEEQYQDLSTRFSEMNFAAIAAAIAGADPEQLVPAEAWAALEALRQAGHPLYVSSAADQNEVRSLARNLGLDRYFVEILGSIPGFSKGPQHIEYILRQQSVPATRVVMVGDEPTDIQLGHTAGVTTIGKAGTYPAQRLADAGADFVIADLAGLPAVLEEIQTSAGNGDLWP